MRPRASCFRSPPSIDLVLLAIAIWITLRTRSRADLAGLLFGLWVALALLLSPLAWIPETLLLLPAYLFGMRAGLGRIPCA